MSKPHFTLTAVQALSGWRLSLSYADGKTFEVDLSDWIHSSQSLAALQDGTLFAQAAVGFQGQSVDWIEDELDLAADNLRNLAVEQAGSIGHERIWTWLHDTGLTLEQAAQALGISRRMLLYYRDGEKPIPRTVWLACLGWQAVRPQSQSLPMRVSGTLAFAP